MDNDGHSVLCWACYRGNTELLEYLTSDSTPMGKFNIYSHSSLILIALHTVPHLGALDGMNRTPLHWAASQNAAAVCSLLTTKKCKRCPTTNEMDLLSVADGEQGAQAKVCPTGKQMIDMRDDDGKTPADCATAKQHAALAESLENERRGVRTVVTTSLPKKVRSCFMSFSFVNLFGVNYCVRMMKNCSSFFLPSSHLYASSSLQCHI